MKSADHYIQQLEKAFTIHNVNCNLVGETLVFPEQYIEAGVSLSDRTSIQAIMQMDVTFSIGLGKHIVESTAGIGKDLDEAAENAWENFMHNCFHTILAAFFTDIFDDMVLREEIIIGEKNYEIVKSHLGIRGKLPENYHTNWLRQFEQDLAQYKLSNGIHWFRYFFAQNAEQITTCEVLFNNYVWQELQDKALTYDYCFAEDFYTVRILYIIQNKPDISRLAKIMATMEDEDTIENEFIKYGLAPSDATKGYLLIQHAFGQVLINRMLKEKTFSDRAIIKTNDGKEYIITLAEELFYTDALELGESICDFGTSRDLKQFQSIAMCSAEFNALNNALHQGGTLNDFEGSVFSEPIMLIPNYGTRDETAQSFEQEPLEDPKKKKKWWRW